MEAELVKLIPDVAKRDKARNKLLDSYGVMILDDIPEDRRAEAVAKVQAYVSAQKQRANSGPK